MNPFEVLTKPINNLNPKLFTPANPAPDVPTPAVKPSVSLKSVVAPLPTSVVQTVKSSLQNAPAPAKTPFSVVASPLPPKVTSLFKTTPVSTTLPESDHTVRKQDWKDVVNLIPQLIGGAIQPAAELGGTALEASNKIFGTNFPTETKIPNIYADEKRGMNALETKPLQNTYHEYVANGDSPVKALVKTTLQGGADLFFGLALGDSFVKNGVELSKNIVKGMAPEKLITPEMVNVTKQEVFDLLSGRKSFDESNLSPDVLQAIKESPNKVEIAKAVLRGENPDIQTLKAVPSRLGEFLGVSQKEAEQILSEVYGGPLREGPAGALPGYMREPGQAPAFGLSTERVNRVGGEYPEIPKDLQPLAEEARKYKSAEEFVKAQTNAYHVTSADAAKSIEQSGFKAQIGERSLGVANAKGTWLYEDKVPTTEFSKNFKNPATVETSIQGKVFDAMNNDKSIRALVEDKKLIAQLKSQGYVAIRGDELGTPATFVFDQNALKTKSQLTDIWNKVVNPSPTLPKEPTFEGFKDISTHVLDSLEGRGVVSKQFISDLTNKPELKQAERDIIRNVLENYPDGASIPVQEFANKVKSELLPLKRGPSGEAGGRYESISLPDDLRGPVASYNEHIYQSPIKTSAGDVHFSGNFSPLKDNYFAHTRIEDLPTSGEQLGNKEFDFSPRSIPSEPTRRVIEIQSDLFQKGRLEGELNNDMHLRKGVGETTPRQSELTAQRAKEIAPLEPYRNTWHERVIREEVKKAAQDGKTKLQFPTGETAMKIEGLGNSESWIMPRGNRPGNPWEVARSEDLKVGQAIRHESAGENEYWIITDVLGDGKFKAVPKDVYESYSKGGKDYKNLRGNKKDIAEDLSRATETFDISGKVDTNNPIYKFYEKEVGRYLKNKYDAKLVTDPQGVKWWEVKVDPKTADQPISAYNLEGDVFDITVEEGKKIASQFFDKDEIKFLFPKETIKTTEGQSAVGQYLPSKVFQNAIVQVVQRNGKIPSLTLYEEMFHAFEGEFMRPEEARKMHQNISNNPLTAPKRKALEIAGYKGKETLAREYVAKDFADFVAGKKYTKANKSFYQKILDKIREWIRKATGMQKAYEDFMAKKRNFKRNPSLKSEGSYKLANEDEIARRREEVQKFQAKAEKQLGRPVPLTAREKRLALTQYEKANSEYLKVVRKEMEQGNPRSRAERNVLVTEARLSDALKEAGKQGDFYKAEEVMANIQTIMETAMPGERVFTGYGSDREVRGIESTFPKWVPENLRSRELFNSVEPSLQLDNISMPAGKRQQELFNVVFDRVDKELGIDTSALRRELADQVRSLPASKVMEREANSLERLLNREHAKTAKEVSAEEKKIRMTKDLERRQALYRLEQERLRQREQMITETRLKAQEKKSFYKVIRDTLFPSQKGVDATTRAILEDWISLKFSAKEAGNETYLELKNKGPQTLEEMNAYEAGKPIEYIRENLDHLGTLAKRAGIDFRFRERYLPHAYMESREMVMKSIERYLKDQGLDEFEIKQYMAGGELAKDKSFRLKLNPFFSKDRVFPSYSAAAKYGLTPKYRSPAKLIAHYQEELETVLANNKLIADLKAEGKLLSELDAPDSWVPVTRRFSKNVYYAEPTLAKALNDVFRDENDLGVIPRLVRIVGAVSRFMQEVKLSAGVPFTNINYFSTGQAIRLLTTAVGETALGDFKGALSTLKSSFAYIRANSNKASAKFFFKNRQYIARMALEGIDMSGRIGNYRFKTLGEQMSQVLAEGKGKGPGGKAIMVKDLFGVGFNKAFNEKTFNSMMSQVSVQTFANSYEAAVASGMTDRQASKFAADTVRNFSGLSKENLRGKTAQDTLASTFFAPKFREGVINVIGNTAASYTPKNFKDASYAKNRAFLLGAIITFGLYQLLNKKTSGHYTWENPPGREFAWRIPLPNKQTGYIEFLPSFAAFPRNITEGGIALSKGDFSTATQKIGSVFSMPLKLATELISNSDYFGREIYKDTDSGKTKIAKMAAYVGLGINHPFITETYKYVSGQEPLYQAVAYMLETPVKFSNLDKEDKTAYYNMLDKQTKQRADLKKKVEPIYQQNQKLKADGKAKEADRIYRALSPSDRKIYDQIKKDAKAKATSARKPAVNAIYEENQKLIEEGDIHGANERYRSLSPADKKIYDSIKMTHQLLDEN